MPLTVIWLSSFQNLNFITVEWDPTGRYVVTYVSHWIRSNDNEYQVWSFLGRRLRKESKVIFLALYCRLNRFLVAKTCPICLASTHAVLVERQGLEEAEERHEGLHARVRDQRPRLLNEPEQGGGRASSQHSRHLQPVRFYLFLTKF